MALFTDGPASSLEDLQGHDSQLLDVAHTEGIDVTHKLGLAQDEVALEVSTILARLDGPGLEHVVVTPALKLWHTFRALELVYRDAYNSQLNDRYAGKRDEYHGLAMWAHEKLVQSGIGIVLDPVPQGTPPVLTQAAGSLVDATYYVSAGWVNAAGEEGATSHPGMITVIGGAFAAATNGAPANVREWNVYAGISPTSLILQNANPLGLDEMWTQSSPPATTGRQRCPGQTPNYVRPAARVLERG